MKLLMISGDRSVLQGKKGAFWYMLEEFSKHWKRIDVIHPRSQIPNRKSQIYSNFQAPISQTVFGNVHFHPSPRGLWYQPWWILRTGRELIAEHRHEVMTVHEYPPFYNGLGARWLHQKTRIPYALEIHHVVGFPRAATLSEWIGRVLSRLFLVWDAKSAARVRTVNASVKECLTAFGIPASNIHVVPSFYLDAQILRPLPGVPKQYDLVFSGRLVPNKGLRTVLDALALLPGVSLLVLGDGPERSACERHARTLGIADRVAFHGWVPDQEALVCMLQSAKVLVMNSLSEGGPRVVLEAMACGMPVIATRVGVMPEVIHDGENGVFTSGEPGDLATKVRGLLDDSSLRDSLGKHAQEVIGRFERKSLIKAYAEFLQHLP